MAEEQSSDEQQDQEPDETPDETPDASTGGEEDGFEGEFDAKRARHTIDRLRNDLKAAKAKAGEPKDTEETAAVRAENLRLRIALKTGLDDDLADRLRGNTEEELLADARKLLDRFYPEDKKPPETRQPKPRLKGGTQPNEEPELSADDIVSKAVSR